MKLRLFASALTLAVTAFSAAAQGRVTRPTRQPPKPTPQRTERPKPTSPDNDEKVHISDEIPPVDCLERKPEFSGGETALYRWLGENIIYPAEAAEEGVQGRVVVEFIVERNGEISNVKIVRPRHPALDAEAMRLIKAMPRWEPDCLNGEPVRVSQTLPITFRLQ